MSSTLRKYLTGSFIGAIGKATGLLSSFGSLWLLNAILTKQGFGEYTVAFTIISIVGLTAQAGLRDVVVQRLAEYRTTNEQSHRRFGAAALSWTAIFSIVLGVLVILLAPAIAALLTQPGLIDWLRLFGVLIPGTALLSVERAVRNGKEEYVNAIGVFQIAPQLLRLGGLAGVYWMWPTRSGVAIALACSYYLPLTASVLLGDEWRSANISAIKRTDWLFAGKLLLNSIASQIFQNIDILLIMALASSTATSDYRVAWKIALIIGYSNNVLSIVLRPQLSSYFAAGNLRGLRDEFGTVRDATIIFAGGVLLAVLLAGEFLLGLFGNYSQNYSLLLLLATGQFMNNSFGNIHEVLLMGEEAKLILLNSLLGILLNTIGNLALIPLYGATGAAISTVVSVFILSNLVVVWMIRTAFDIDILNIIVTGGAFATSGITLSAVVYPTLFSKFAASVAIIIYCTVIGWRNRTAILEQFTKSAKIGN